MAPHPNIQNKGNQYRHHQMYLFTLKSLPNLNIMSLIFLLHWTSLIYSFFHGNLIIKTSWILSSIDSIFFFFLAPSNSCPPSTNSPFFSLLRSPCWWQRVVPEKLKYNAKPIKFADSKIRGPILDTG